MGCEVSRNLYKKNHFVPYAYLKSFRIDLQKEKRKEVTGHIYTNLKYTGKVLLESICFQNQLYTSVKGSDEYEKIFKLFEDDWRVLLEKSIGGGIKDISASILVNILLLNFRNRVIINSTDYERGELVFKALTKYFLEKFLKQSYWPTLYREVGEIFNSNWDVRLIRMCDLITSDNPAVITRDMLLNGFGPIFLPVSPDSAFVVINKDFYTFSKGVGDKKDSELINLYVAYQHNIHIVSSKQIENFENLKQAINKNREKLPTDEGSFTNTRFKPSIQRYRHDKNGFSFLQMKVPL